MFHQRKDGELIRNGFNFCFEYNEVIFRWNDWKVRLAFRPQLRPRLRYYFVRR